MAWTRHDNVVALADEAPEPLSDFRTHLTFLGYTTELHDDGWVSATNPVRPDFFARQLPFGVRLLAKFHLGHLDKPLFARWLAYVNEQNDDSLLVKLAVHVENGEATLRAIALLPFAYERTNVGVLLDLWHREVRGSDNAPPVGTSGDETQH
ncbi:MAG: hypothetical protein JNM38_14010 [Acidobacteria bacterium]|nr:hypothetical protein [Acidobacteriota bacterium]